MKCNKDCVLICRCSNCIKNPNCIDTFNNLEWIKEVIEPCKNIVDCNKCIDCSEGKLFCNNFVSLLDAKQRLKVLLTKGAIK